VLWEAIWGVRPFRGETARMTAVSVVKGMIDDPPKHVRVPTWLRRVLQRGLCAEPSDRYPDMNALLAALRRESTRKVRRGIAIGAGVVGLGIGAVLAMATIERNRETCDGGESRLVGVWDDEVRAQVRSAFMASELAYAQTAFVGVERELDEYVAAWRAQHREACEATHMLREQSHEMLDLRMACLRGRLDVLRALTSEFSAADADVVEHAVEATAAIGRLEACADTEALAARVRPPEDPIVRRRVDELRESLADAKAKEAAGRYESALALAEDVAKEAAVLEYPPVTAEAHLRLGSVLERKGDFAGAERELLQSILEAEASEHQSIAAEAWVRLVWVTGVEREDTDKGQLWAQFADAAVRGLGKNDILRAQLVHNEGGLLYRQGRYAEAFESYQRALEVQERLLGPDDPLVAMTYNHMGNVEIMRGDLPSAREYCRRSLDLRRRVLGERHPKVAASLNNLAVIAFQQGDDADAQAIAGEALSIVGGSDGAEEVVALRVALQAATRAGRNAAAVRHAERLIDVHDRLGDPVQEASALAELGHAQARLGQLDDAIVSLQRSVALARHRQPQVAARTLEAIAAIERERGHAQAATAALADARALSD
ncbi:MAG TPA: tetratricopeptide repeat protein, partial [Nannocystaceae bacterium]|nr:tetratricopeptide repeat protein [Nannocystaceae bacterium]